MNKEVGVKSSSLLRDEDFCDLTLGITSSSAGNNRITTSEMYREEPQQQQTVAVAAAIKPNPSNRLTSTTPTMITRSIKEQTEQDKEKD